MRDLDEGTRRVPTSRPKGPLRLGAEGPLWDPPTKVLSKGLGQRSWPDTTKN